MSFKSSEAVSNEPSVSGTVTAHSDVTDAGSGQIITAGERTAIGDAIHDNVAGEIAAITEKGVPASGDFLLIEDSADSNNKKRIQVGNLPTGGGGEANTGSNQGTDGVGVFDLKSGVDLQFRNIAPASNKVSVVLNGKDIDLDVNEGNLTLATNLNDGLMPAVDKHYANNASMTGWVLGGVVTYGTNPLDVDVASGHGFFNDDANDASSVVSINWTAATLTMAAGSVNHIYITNGGVVSSSTALPDLSLNIILATAYTNGSEVTFLSEHTNQIVQHAELLALLAIEMVGSRAVSGLLATINGGDVRAFDVAAGVFYVGANRKSVGSTTAATFTTWRTDGAGEWITVQGTTQIDITNLDDLAGALTAMTAGFFRKDVLFVAESGDGVEYHVVFGAEEYEFQTIAEAARTPDPPDELRDFAGRIAGLVVEQGVGIVSIIDEKLLAGQQETDSPSTNEIRSQYFPAFTSGAIGTNGQHVVISVASNGNENFSFAIPEDFAQLISLELIGIPSAGAAQTGRDIDLISEYAAVGEASNLGSETDTTTVYDLSGTGGLITDVVDLSVVFAGVGAGDLCGVNIDHNALGGAIQYLGIRLVYAAEVN